jgi:hypothetical protein
MDILITYTYDLQLQAITLTKLISTIHKSLHQPFPGNGL